MRAELRNLCTFISGGDKPSVFSIEKTKTCGVPVYANAVENDGLIGYTNKHHVEGDTVTIAARGSGCGFVSYRDDAYTPVVRLLCLIPNRNLIYPKYLYYLLKCNKIRSYGSGQPQITIPQIADFVIEYDDNINNQKKIADFLWSIELKIKINNRINDNLYY